VRWHDLRHTFGSLLAGAGVDLVTIFAAVGYSALATIQPSWSSIGGRAPKPRQPEHRRVALPPGLLGFRPRQREVGQLPELRDIDRVVVCQGHDHDGVALSNDQYDVQHGGRAGRG